MGLIILGLIVIVVGLVLYKQHKAKESKVPQGLQVFNEDADLVLDVTDTLGKVFSYIDVDRQNLNTANYVIQDPIFLEGTPFIFCTDNSFCGYQSWQTTSYGNGYTDNSGRATFRYNQYFIWISSIDGDKITISVTGYSAADSKLRVYYGIY